ncbi:two-partner secretion domain-containing protein [Allocoleopsis franciscana]|nr:filamentous hemagglutinin N-terminal domain-containing protein [Allocoleopsis franciscana]
MTRQLFKLTCYLGLGGAITLSGCLVNVFSGNYALAQIAPDTTLGAESSVSTPLDAQGLPIDRIDGGAIRGTNLFHSFLEFNVAANRGAYFFSPVNIQNILARVTGSNASQILGTLGTFGASNPNLFLINPNGIIFGENASLDVGGSFVATTATAIQFGNQGFFSASNPEAPALLTVNPSAFFFNQINAGRIENGSIAPAGLDLTGAPLFGLRVPEGRSLLFIGGDIALDRGRVNALGGRVELAGVAGTGTVGLNIDGNNLSVSVPENITRADISISNKARVNVTADDGGDIVISAHNLDILEGSFLSTGIGLNLGTANSQAGDITLDATSTVTISGSDVINIVNAGAIGQGGNMIVRAKSLFLTDSAFLAAVMRGRGDTGRVFVEVTEAALLTQGSTIFNTVQRGIGNGGDIIFIAGSASFLEGAQLVADNRNAEGNGGNITVQVRDHIFIDGVYSDGFASGIFAAVTPGGRGNAGNITLTAGSLSLTNGGRLQSNTRGLGDAGNIIIDVRDHIVIDGIDSPLGSGTPSGVYTTVGTDGVGKGGDIYVTAGSLTATNGGQLTANTFEQGDAGNVTIVVRGHVSFDGVNTDIPNNPSSSGVFSAVGEIVEMGRRIPAVGQGGNIHITADSLSVTNGAQIGTIVTSGSQGDAGSVTVITRKTASFDGVNNEPSGIFTYVESGAIGNANDIDITTGVLSVSNGAQLSAITAGKGDAGDIRVRANTLNITQGGQFLTTTEGSSRAGDINLDILDSVVLAGANSGLLANTTEGSSGNGGSIFINNSRDVLIQDGARIAVDSKGAGVGGNIEIQADTLTLQNQARLLAETASNTGGNITLQLQDLLLLRNNSKISTTAGTDQAGGDGGNITIDAKFIVGVPKEDSDITANAFQGQGGNINITTQGIYGLQFRPRLTPLSDITASSEFGLDGEFQLDLLTNVDPSRGLAQLPTNIVDASDQIDRRCTPAASTQEPNSFTITGRGGLPPSPNDPLQNESIITNWVSLDSDVETKTAPVSITPKSSTPKPLVEAQGWMLNHKGEVVLTAAALTATPQGEWFPEAECNAPSVQSQ